MIPRVPLNSSHAVHLLVPEYQSGEMEQARWIEWF